MRPEAIQTHDSRSHWLADSARRGRCLMRGSDRMHALYLHFTDAPLSDYARAGNHSAALQITFIFYSAEICMISKSRNSSPDPIELNSGVCVVLLVSGYWYYV